MPILLYFLGVGALGALAYRAGQAKTAAARGHDPLDDIFPPPPASTAPLPPTPAVQGVVMGCYEVRHGGKVGLATGEQAIEIGRSCPGATFRRIG